MSAAIRYCMERKRNEQRLREAHQYLEAQVSARTVELTEANQRLRGQIENRKQVERALLEREVQLRASEERYRIICEKSSDGIAILQGGRAVFVNPALAAMMKTPVHVLEGIQNHR